MDVDARCVVWTHAGVQYVRYECPACKHTHHVPSERWNWNGDVQRPTLHPSVRHYYIEDDGRQVTVCHYFVRDGRIEFCSDCPHAYAGKTVDLPVIEEEREP